MPRALHIVITVILLIVMLGILISAHEAGHLAMAKAFGVYCDEYSIGFGPKIFSKRRKGGETAFSLRVIPLGGYVSMYSAEDEPKRKKRNGEEAVESENIMPEPLLDANGNPVPLERSLESQKTWKRIIIISAGVVVNFILSFIFCLIYSVSFPYYQNYVLYKTDIAAENVSSYVYDKGRLELNQAESNIVLYGFFADVDETIPVDEGDYLYSPGFLYNSAQTDGGYLIDCNTIVRNAHTTGDRLITLYYPASQSEPNDFMSCLKFYSVHEDITDSTYNTLQITSLPDMDEGAYKLGLGDAVDLTFTTIHRAEDRSLVLTPHAITVAYGDNGWAASPVTVTSIKYWPSFGDRLELGCRQWVNFFPMMGNALKQLFTFHFDGIGGVIAMGAGISQLSSYMGFGKTFFLYGGLISLNLGIINILPFPGLDGWSVLVAIIEKIRRKKISARTKKIVQMVGFGLLIALAVFITIKDIFQFVV